MRSTTAHRCFLPTCRNRSWPKPVIQILTEETRTRFFLGLVAEIFQIAFAGRALGCDDRPLDAAAAQRPDDVCDVIGCGADNDDAGAGLLRGSVQRLVHRSNPTRGDVQSEHAQLLRRIGRRKSARKTLAIGIGRVNEADFWLLHHGAQMFRNRARLRRDRRQRTKIVFIAGCQ